MVERTGISGKTGIVTGKTLVGIQVIGMTENFVNNI
jgi:hypothetical protein